MHSRIMGGFTFCAGADVSPVSLNLSCSLPLFLPQKNVASNMSIVGMLITNSFVSSISLCEYLSGLMLMATSGGLIEVGIAHARVMMFGFPVLPVHETRMVCIGWRSIQALERFTSAFDVLLFCLCVIFFTVYACSVFWLWFICV